MTFKRILMFDAHRNPRWYGGVIIPETVADRAKEWIPYHWKRHMTVFERNTLCGQAYCFEYFGRWPDVEFTDDGHHRFWLNFDTDTDHIKWVLKHGMDSGRE